MLKKLQTIYNKTVMINTNAIVTAYEYHNEEPEAEYDSFVKISFVNGEVVEAIGTLDILN